MADYSNSRWKERGSFNKDILHSYQDIVDAIRTAPYGIDTREAMAQMLIFLYSAVQNMSNGFGVDMSPTDSFRTLQELKQKYPNGQKGVYVIQENGKWYFWSELENMWKEGGFYQASAPIDDIRAVDAKATSNANLLKSLLADFTKEVTERKKIDADLVDNVASYLTAIELKEVHLKNASNNLMWDGNRYLTGKTYLPRTDKTGLEEGVPIDSSIIGYTFLGHLEEYGLPILKIESPDLLSLQTKADGKLSGVKFDYNPNGFEGHLSHKTGVLKSIKVQGSSSQFYPKKNYTLSFDSPFELKTSWGYQKKYVIKADWVDFSHMRNELGAWLWGRIRKTRLDEDNSLVDNDGNVFVRTEVTRLGGEIRPQFAMGMNYGAIDSYPVLVIINDIYHGLYSMTVPKDDWLAGMGNGNKEAIVSAENRSEPTRFKEHVHIDDNGNLFGDDFSMEYVTDENNQTWLVDSLNNLIDAIKTQTDLDKHLDIESAIDYMILNITINNIDALDKNFLLNTWDGKTWSFAAYDMDATFGNYWDGKSYLKVDNAGIDNYKVSNLYKLIIENHTSELLARWNYLRNSVLADYELNCNLYNFATKIPAEVLSYERKRWPSRPGTITNNLNQISDWIRLRTAYLDEQFKKLGGK